MSRALPAEPLAPRKRALAVALAARPKTLLLALSPVMVATALAAHHGRFEPWLTALCAAGAAAIQIGTNFINDWADAARGADDARRLGPVRMTSSGGLQSAQVLQLGLAAFAGATCAGAALVWAGGWPVVWVGLSGLVAGFCYTGGPFPLAYHGLGEVFAFVYFGPVAVMTTAYLHLGYVPPGAAAIGASMGAFAAVVLALNNLRDRVGDARVHKKTLAVRLGESGARILVACLLLLAFVPIASALWRGTLPVACRCALWACVPAGWLLWEVATRQGRALNAMLLATSLLQATTAALLAWGLLGQD